MTRKEKMKILSDNYNAIEKYCNSTKYNTKYFDNDIEEYFAECLLYLTTYIDEYDEKYSILTYAQHYIPNLISTKKEHLASNKRTATFVDLSGYNEYGEGHDHMSGLENISDGIDVVEIVTNTMLYNTIKPHLHIFTKLHYIDGLSPIEIAEQYKKTITQICNTIANNINDIQRSKEYCEMSQQ